MGKNERGQRARQDAFLAAMARLGNITLAAEAADIARNTHYSWMQHDPTYPERFAQAEEESADRLEREARRRAEEGVTEYVTSGGKLIMDPDDPSRPLLQRRYSDSLMSLLLRGHRPERFRDRAEVAHTGPGGGPIRSEVKADVTPEFVAAVLGHLRDASHEDPAGDPGEPLDPSAPEEAKP